MAVGWAMAGANLVSGLMGADAAKSASNTQAQSAANALDFQKQQFNTIQQQTTGGRAAGANALNQLGALGSGTYQMYDANGNPIGAGTGSGFLTQQSPVSIHLEPPWIGICQPDSLRVLLQLRGYWSGVL